MTTYHRTNEEWFSGAAAGRSNDRIKLFTFPKNSITYFYLLPPWSERGAFAKSIQQTYGLPGKVYHTLWSSYEDRAPGIADKDPVMEVLSQWGKKYPADLKQWIQSPKFHVNILIEGIAPLTPEGHVDRRGLKKHEPPTVETVGLSYTVWKEICTFRQDPAAGPIENPTKSVMVMVKRTEENGKTSYKTTFNAEEGIETRPRYADLSERFGAEIMDKILSNVPNLDERWPPPDEEETMRARERAARLRVALAALAMERQKGGLAQATGPGEVTLTAPAVAVAITGTAATPAPKTRLPTVKEILSLDLKEYFAEAPLAGPNQPPVCLKHFDEISKGPNGAWCASCAFRHPCRLTTGASK